MAGVRVVRGEQLATLREGMERLVGVSGATTGAEGLFMAIQRVPPGARTRLHRHTNCETASFNLRGTVKVYSGEHMEEVQEAGPGDFMYIAANAWHVIENASQTEWAEAVIARNAAEEIVEDYPLEEMARI